MNQQRKEELANDNWDKWCNSDAGRESLKWTAVNRCLDGTATENEYCSLDAIYRKCDANGYIAVGPEFGPIRIGRC